MQQNSFTIQTFDAIILKAYRHCVPNPVGNVIIVHGLGEHCSRYEHVIRLLNEKNFNVYTYDQRGHGESAGESAYIDSYIDYYEDLQRVVQYAKKDSPDVKTFILGHSMGGFVTALYGELTKDEVSGIILSGAATNQPKQARGIMRPLLKTFGKIAKHQSMGNNLGKVVSRDQKIVEKYENDPLNKKKITFGLYNEFLIKGIDFVKSHASDFSYPVLILHGRNDRIVDASASEKFFEGISSKDKNLVIYPGLYHEIMNEPEKEQVLGDITAWLEQRIR